MLMYHMPVNIFQTEATLQCAICKCAHQWVVLIVKKNFLCCFSFDFNHI